MKQIPLKEFFKNKDNYNYKLSPNGKLMAFLKTFDKRLNIWIRDIESNEEFPITKQQKRNISTFLWKNNDTILFLQDNDGDENHHMFRADLESKEVTDITPYENVKVLYMGIDSLNKETIIENKKQYKNKILISHNKRDPRTFDLILKDILSLEEEIIFKAEVGAVPMLLDKEEMKIKYFAQQHLNGSTFYKIENNEFNKLKTISSKDSLQLLGFNEDKSKIYALSNVGVDKVAFYEYDLDLNERELIFSHELVDLTNVLIDKMTRKPLAVTYDEDKARYYFLDKNFETDFNAAREKLLKEFPEEVNSEFNYHKNIFVEGLEMATTFADNHLPQEYLLENKKIVKLSKKEEYLNSENLVESKYVSYKSRDGLTIYGYLTLPKDAKGPVPFIVNPHGGPWVRDYWGYNAEVQFLASRGFGVLQPNFRISTGYGKEFFVKGWKQWGLSCQDDVTDGTQWLIEQGYADPERIAIYGGSYGGYATLMGIIREPDLYAAAIDYVGVSDLFSFWDGFPDYWKAEGNIFEEAMGNPYKNEELAKKVSPIYHVDKIKTPLMIVQGGQDPRVPQKQADLIYAKLKERGIESEYILKKDEGHGFANQENKFELYEKMIDFLNKNMNIK